jgi:TRAP-type C4-dicarboxylate transport system permease small subunit
MGSKYLKVAGVVTLGAASIALLILMFYISADVVGRYIANKPMPATFEIAETIMVIVVFFGLGWVQARGKHMRLDFFFGKFSPRKQEALNVFIFFIGLLIAGIILWQGWEQAWEAWTTGEYMEGLWKIPYYPARFALVVGMFLLCLQYIIDLVHSISVLKTR